MSLANFTSINQKERPAFVRFVTEAVEDKPASRAAGYYVAKDVDFAHITAPGTREVFIQKVSDWLEHMKQHVADGRIPAEWQAQYQEQYRLWKMGQEMPVNGTPIKGWGVTSPALQETLIRMHVRTVEDLAALNDEGLRRIGMGAVDLKNKAVAWLAQLQDKGPLTMQMAALQKEMEHLKAVAQTLDEQNKKLQAMLPERPLPVAFIEPSSEITAADIIEDEKPRKGKR